MRARAELRAAAPLVDRGPLASERAPRVAPSGTGCRLTWVRDAPPIAFRPTPEAVYIVGTAAFPVGDDRVSVEVHVEDGASLAVRSAASAVAWAGTGSSLEVDVTVDPGGQLDWQLQPLIASTRCQFSQRSRVHLNEGATVRWAEEVVLGRSGEDPGWLDLRLDVTVDGVALLRHQLEIGKEVPGWGGPAVMGTNRAVGLVLLAGAAGAGLEHWRSLPRRRRRLGRHAARGTGLAYHCRWARYPGLTARAGTGDRGRGCSARVWGEVLAGVVRAKTTDASFGKAIPARVGREFCGLQKGSREENVPEKHIFFSRSDFLAGGRQAGDQAGTPNSFLETLTTALPDAAPRGLTRAGRRHRRNLDLPGAS